jgi:hypothetical protein
VAEGEGDRNGEAPRVAQQRGRAVQLVVALVAEWRRAEERPELEVARRLGHRVCTGPKAVAVRRDEWQTCPRLSDRLQLLFLLSDQLDGRR